MTKITSRLRVAFRLFRLYHDNIDYFYLLPQLGPDKDQQYSVTAKYCLEYEAGHHRKGTKGRTLQRP
jgi:hypothetical protein